MARNLLFLFSVFFFSLTIIQTSTAQETSIGKKLVCNESDSENPTIFKVKKGAMTEVTFDEATAIASRLVRKAKAALKIAKRSGSSREVKRAKKKRKNAIKNKNKVAACAAGVLDPPSSANSTATVTGSPNSSITGSCKFSYFPTSAASLSGPALASQSTMNIRCTMTGATGSNAFGDVIRKPVGGKRKSTGFISGTNIENNAFSVIFCETGIEGDCDRANDFAAALADPNQTVSISFTFAENQFSGAFPGLE